MQTFSVNTHFHDSGPESKLKDQQEITDPPTQNQSPAQSGEDAVQVAGILQCVNGWGEKGSGLL